MVALVVFPIMATSLGTIPNRCLSVTNLSTSWSCGPKSHRPKRPALPARLPNFRPPVDLLAYIDAIPPPHAADRLGRASAIVGGLVIYRLLRTQFVTTGKRATGFTGPGFSATASTAIRNCSN